MDLFDTPDTLPTNILPRDGRVYYFHDVFGQTLSDQYFQTLLKDIHWQHDKVNIMGKDIVTKRKVAWCGDDNFAYTYSGATKIALPWTPLLLEIKQHIEHLIRHTRVRHTSGECFNSCLLNLYHNGDEGMGWHSDAEKTLKKHGAIASVSFGAERKFLFKHKRTGEKVEQWLGHGSVLLMAGETQRHWLHRLPPTKKVQTPRINLTFRTFIAP